MERESLKKNIEKLYVQPFHAGIYEGNRSPRELFQGKPLILLMDLALGMFTYLLSVYSYLILSLFYYHVILIIILIPSFYRQAA